ncbi:hypothetical protein VKT23_000253 [Stygiomarasmius scandens]|uniref:Uncharacterized protein n=1 Tax=Marasmiellus scandens TaxID=2682957 RepID=A0ABR1K5F8_9AGAR
MGQFQEHQGFDPSTQDFAQVYGLPLVEVIPPQKIFSEEEVSGTIHDTVDEKCTEETMSDIFYDMIDTLDQDTDSEYEDASSQIEEIWFSVPEHLPEPEVSSESNAGADFSFDSEPTDIVSEDVVVSATLGMVGYLLPSRWLYGYILMENLEAWKGSTNEDGSKLCWKFASSIDSAADSPTYMRWWWCAECYRMASTYFCEWCPPTSYMHSTYRRKRRASM